MLKLSHLMLKKQGAIKYIQDQIEKQSKEDFLSNASSPPIAGEEDDELKMTELEDKQTRNAEIQKDQVSQKLRKNNKHIFQEKVSKFFDQYQSFGNQNTSDKEKFLPGIQNHDSTIIRLKDKFYLILTGVQDFKNSHQLIVFEYVDPEKYELIYEVSLMEACPSYFPVSCSKVWTNNGKFIYYFKIKNQLTVLHRFDLIEKIEIKLDRFTLENKNLGLIIFSQKTFDKNQRDIKLLREADFLENQIIGIFTKNTEQQNELLFGGILKLANYDEQKNAPTENSFYSIDVKAKINLFYFDYTTQQEGLALNNNLVFLTTGNQILKAFDVKCEQEDAEEEIMTKTVLSQRNLEIIKEQLKSELFQMIKLCYQESVGRKIYIREQWVTNKEQEDFVLKIIEDLFQIGSKEISSVLILFAQNMQTCTIFVNIPGAQLLKEMELNTCKIQQNLSHQLQNPFSWACKHINYGYQIHSSFHNLFIQNDDDDYKIIYVDENDQTFDITCKLEDFEIQNESAIANNFFKLDQLKNRGILFQGQSTSNIRPRLALNHDDVIEIQIYNFETQRILVSNPILEKSNLSSVCLCESSNITILQNRKYEQNYAVSTIKKGEYKCQILEFKLIWTTSLPKKWNCGSDVCSRLFCCCICCVQNCGCKFIICKQCQKVPNPNTIELIGNKILLFNKPYSFDKNLMLPNYSLKNKSLINGVQWLQKDFCYQVENLNPRECYSTTNIAIAGYKNIFKEGEEQPVALLVESQLSPLLDGEYFTSEQKWSILDTQNMISLNMVPHGFNLYLNSDFNDKQIDLFQPYEALKGHNMVDFKIQDPKSIKNFLKRENHIEKLSLLQSFIKTNEEIPIGTFDNLIRSIGQLFKDNFLSNSIQRTFDLGPNNVEVAKLLIEHLLSKQKNFTEYEILMQLMPTILKSEERFMIYKKFFLQGGEQFISTSYKPSFGWKVEDVRLPVFSHLKNEINKVEYNIQIKDQPLLDYITNETIQESDYRRNKFKRIHEVENHIIDFRSVQLDQKLNFLQDIYLKKLNDKGKESKRRTLVFSDFLLSDMIKKLAMKYPDDIDTFKVVTQIIEQQFEQTEKTAMFQLNFILFLDFIPLLIMLYSTNSQLILLCWILIVIANTFIVTIQFKRKYKYYGCKKFFSNFYNIMDYIIYVLCLTVGYAIRSQAQQNGQAEKFLPQNSYILKEFFPISSKVELFNMIVDFTILTFDFTIVLLLAFCFKITNNMKVIKSFGFLAELIESCLKDVAWFLFFYLILIVVFMILNIVIDCDATDQNSAPKMPEIFYQFLYVFQTSIGKQGRACQSKNKDDHKRNSVLFVLYLLNLVLMFIIMFSFLINIISHSYDSVMTRKHKYVLVQRAIMNQEFRIHQAFLPVKQQISRDLIMVAGQKEPCKEEITGESNGFVLSIRQYLKSECQVFLTKLQSRTSNHNEVLSHNLLQSIDQTIMKKEKDANKLIDDMNKQIDEFQDTIQRLMKKGKKKQVREQRKGSSVVSSGQQK